MYSANNLFYNPPEIEIEEDEDGDNVPARFADQDGDEEDDEEDEDTDQDTKPAKDSENFNRYYLKQ